MLLQRRFKERKSINFLSRFYSLKHIYHSAAEKYAKRYTKEFATSMRRELGMKVLVMTVHVDIKGAVTLAASVVITIHPTIYPRKLMTE